MLLKGRKLIFAQAIAILANASPDTDKSGKPNLSSNLAVRVSTSFPQSEVFGVKLVNGRPTNALLSFTNEESNPVSLTFVGGSLWGPDPKTKGETDAIVRNVTSTKYNVEIQPGEKEVITYSFATELHPQELRLNLLALITTQAGGLYTLSAYNETVAIVEPDASIFDPQLIFLYLLLAVLFGGSCYFLYTTWIAALFQQKPPRKSGDRVKRSAGSTKKGESVDQSAGSEVNGPAATTGAKPYDESWIPEHHIHRPEAKRIKTGGSRPKSKGKPE